MAKNENLHRAKDAKKDEFYTQYEDIQNELNHYEQHFKERPCFAIAMTLLKAIFVNSFCGTSIISV